MASSRSSEGPNAIEWDICLYEYYILILQSKSKLLNRMHSWKQSFRGASSILQILSLWVPFFVCAFFCLDLERWKAWWNSSLLATAQADSSVGRSNRWPWSWVARKLVIKYFNSDRFGYVSFFFEKPGEVFCYSDV